jgi:hypothetical protein
VRPQYAGLVEAEGVAGRTGAVEERDRLPGDPDLRLDAAVNAVGTVIFVVVELESLGTLGEAAVGWERVSQLERLGAQHHGLADDAGRDRASRHSLSAGIGARSCGDGDDRKQQGLGAAVHAPMIVTGRRRGIEGFPTLP